MVKKAQNILTIKSSMGLKTSAKAISKEIEKFLDRHTEGVDADKLEILLLELHEIKDKFDFLVRNTGRLSLEELEDEYGYESWEEWHDEAVEKLRKLADTNLKTESGEQKFLRIMEK